MALVSAIRAGRFSEMELTVPSEKVNGKEQEEGEGDAKEKNGGVGGGGGQGV